MTTPAAAAVEPDPGEALRREYVETAAAMWRALLQHEARHGCGGPRSTCEIARPLLAAWCQTHQMAEALDFLLLGDAPPIYTHWGTDAGVEWMPEYFAGPWAAVGMP